MSEIYLMNIWRDNWRFSIWRRKRTLLLMLKFFNLIRNVEAKVLHLGQFSSNKLCFLNASQHGPKSCSNNKICWIVMKWFTWWNSNEIWVTWWNWSAIWFVMVKLVWNFQMSHKFFWNLIESWNYLKFELICVNLAEDLEIILDFWNLF